MSLAAAPITSASILNDLQDLEPSDITPAIFIEEIEIVQKFSEKGLQMFHNIMQSECDNYAGISSPGVDDEQEVIVPPTGKFEEQSNTVNKIHNQIISYPDKTSHSLSLAILCSKTHQNSPLALTRS